MTFSTYSLCIGVHTCSNNDVTDEGCDYILENMAKMTMMKWVLLAMSSLLLAGPIATDLDEAIAEEGIMDLLREQDGWWHTKTPLIPRLVLRFVFRFQQFVLPWIVASATVVILVTSELSAVNIILNVAAVAFITEMDDMLATLFIPDTIMSEIQGVIDAVKNKGDDKEAGEAGAKAQIVGASSQSESPEQPTQEAAHHNEGGNSWLGARCLALACTSSVVILVALSPVYFKTNNCDKHQYLKAFLGHPLLWIFLHFFIQIGVSKVSPISKVAKSFRSNLYLNLFTYFVCVVMMSFYLWPRIFGSYEELWKSRWETRGKKEFCGMTVAAACSAIFFLASWYIADRSREDDASRGGKTDSGETSSDEEESGEDAKLNGGSPSPRGDKRTISKA